MNYLFLGEGPNDKLVVPIILENHGIEIKPSEFKTWSSLHGRGMKGFKKKAKLAIALARIGQKDGLVATLDADDQRNRIKLLEDARRDDRNDLAKERIPVVIGQANPELEAWLLDDAEAVKSGLCISSEEKIPSPGSVPDVKVALNELFGKSNIEGRAACLEAVAKCVSCETSRTPDKSGLQQFIDDARSETRL